MTVAHRIRVMGREIQVRTAASAEAVRKVEILVQEKVAEVEAAVKGGDNQVIAILTMMNLAEALLETTRENEALRQQSSQRLTQLIHRLDEALA